ncbi:cytochrome P450 CYP94D108-like [Malania oleifera]|uniref:cytochrome P450 CYP94D108-like n=1 Tax=Malania oleifera TaxID=397392 RepID=UPI0025AECA75|nr:cytochrome P450 CYP94D108-like [Malania oleifera]
MELFSLQSLLFVSLSIYLCLCFYLSNNKPKTTQVLPTYPLLGTLPAFLKNRRRFLNWTTDVLRRCPTHTVVLQHPGNIHGIITANPSNVEHILKTNFPNYPKGQRFIWLLEDFLGRGIFNSDGELWKVQRKTASYEFNTKSLRNFVFENVAVEIRTRLVPVLKSASETLEVLDLQDVLERFAFDNVCKVAFDVDPACLGGENAATGGNGGEFMRAFEDAATLSSERFMYAFPYILSIKKFLNMGSERRLSESIRIVHEFADKIIRSRLAEKSNRTGEDLLSRFIGNDENSAEFLRDIVISFILAGRDTTSSALAWFFWLLASNPDVEKKIQDELETIRVRSAKHIGDSYNFDELREMNYLHAAISESLRLYPPVPVDTKACLGDDVMPDGTFVGKGWFVTYDTYAMGRMESIWGEDCCEFRPERWLEGGWVRQESPYRFPVFHAGPRMCLGKDMAYIQMKSIAASMIERFHMSVRDSNTCPEHVLSLTLRMKGGLPVKVRERCYDGSPTFF